MSCIAAAFGGAQQHANTSPFETKRELSSDEVAEVVRTLDGSRVVAGTTAGDLRVWSGTLALRLGIFIFNPGFSLLSMMMLSCVK